MESTSRYIHQNRILIKNDPECLLYKSFFEKIVIHQIKDANQTIVLRKEMIRRKLKNSIDHIITSDFDINTFSWPCVIGATDLDNNFKIQNCNMSFASKLMIPKPKILECDLLDLTLKPLRSYYRKMLAQLIKSGKETVETLILIYKGMPHFWRQHNF